MIAICFWGLTRSLSYTIDSIQTHIFNVLKSHNLEYDIYLHTYTFESEYVNVWANERNIKLNFDEYKLLKPTYFQIDDQDKIKVQLKLHNYRTYKDHWNSNYVCCDNFICSLYSKLQVAQMIEQSGKTYKYIIYCRPDVKYLNNLPIDILNKINDVNIVTPIFNKWNGLNDRFFIGNYTNGLRYGKAFNELLNYSRRNKIHSETFIKWYLGKRYTLTNVDTHFFFNRVRCDGNELLDANEYL